MKSQGLHYYSGPIPVPISLCSCGCHVASLRSASMDTLLCPKMDPTAVAAYGVCSFPDVESDTAPDQASLNVFPVSVVRSRLLPR